MNYSIVRHIIFRVLEFQAIFLLLPFIVSLIYKEEEGWAYLAIAAGCLAVGAIGAIKKPANKVFFAREGFVTVSLSWIILSLTGALPLWLSGGIPHYPDALFEIISGFTTTGSSILHEVEALSYCNIFWRCFSHWIGGMGVLVFIMAILPMSGGYNMYLMRAESPGPSVEKLVPRVKYTARILYSIYIVMTLILIVILLFCGMNLFDAMTHAFGTAGTGGFGVKNDSLASYSTQAQVVITIFMILFGINFNVYYLLLTKKIKDAFLHEEMRYYLLIIFAAIALISWNARGMFDNMGEAVQQAAFQVASIITTTGFATTDFCNWPIFSQTVLVILMFIGACAGSTGGGIKVSRVAILFKVMAGEISKLLHPKRVKKIWFERHPVSAEIYHSVEIFLAAYLFIFVISLLVVALDGLDFTTNFTAVTTALNNVGPGLSKIGPMGNFDVFSDRAKFVLMFDMLAGRLEVFPILVTLAPDTWKRNQ